MSVTAIKHFFSPAWEYMRARSAGGQLEGMTLSSIKSASLHNWFFCQFQLCDSENAGLFGATQISRLGYLGYYSY